MVSGSGKGHNAECQHGNLKNGFGNLYILFSFIFIYFLDFHVVFFLPKLYTLNEGMCDIQVRQSRLQRGVSKLRVLTCFNIPPGSMVVRIGTQCDPGKKDLGFISLLF